VTTTIILPWHKLLDWRPLRDSSGWSLALAQAQEGEWFRDQLRALKVRRHDLRCLRGD
jgi:hypothetical protein